MRQNRDYPTEEEQQDAIDVIVRLALMNGPGNEIYTSVIAQLQTLNQECGIRVANVMVMLAGAAVQNTQNWKQILKEHFKGAECIEE